MISLPIEKVWREITYHPQPFTTIMKHPDEAKYWKEEGCTFKTIPVDWGIFKGCSPGVRVEISWPETYTETYVEPLATIHKEFWNVMSEVVWDCYPFKTRRFKYGTMVHGLVAYVYWEADWKSYTPDEWADYLNRIVKLVREEIIKKDADLEGFEGMLRELK